MKQLFVFIKKEFLHVFRDRKTLFILFGMPVVQILIFGFALSNEVKNAKLVIIDHARDASSKKLVSKITSVSYFTLEKMLTDDRQIEPLFKAGTIRLAVVIPQNFEHDLTVMHSSQVQVIADASDPNQANTLANYVSFIISDYQREINQTTASIPYRIVPEVRMLYNPQLKGATNFVPGVMALVLMLVCVMMTAVSIVKEKETGTMEILLVSPFKPFFVIMSKAIPYLVLSLVNVISILLLSVFVLDLPIKGSLVLLFAESTLFIITCLTLGIFISIKTASQQAAMLISFMGMLLPTILFSGFMFPIENMPLPLQIVSNIVPSKWFYIIIKSIMIKGLGFHAIMKETAILAGITFLLLIVSLKNFKTRLA